MATSITAAALPTSNGATIIQANAFKAIGFWRELQPAAVQFRMKAVGQHLYKGQKTAAKPSDGVVFYERNNMPSGSEALASIVQISREYMQHTIAPANQIAGVDSPAAIQKKALVRVVEFTPIYKTKSTGVIYLDVDIVAHEILLHFDDEVGNWSSVTNGYQFSYEVVSLLFEPVAAGAPTSRASAVLSGILA